MIALIRVAPFVLLSVLISGGSLAMELSDFQREGKRLLSKDGADYYTWASVPASLLQKNTQPQTLHSYRNSIQREFRSTDARFLIRRQRQVYVNEVISKNPQANWILGLFDIVLKRRVGQIRSLSILESYLFGSHINVNQSHWFRTEFTAFILKKGDQLKIYAGFGRRESGIAPSYEPLRSRLIADLKQGWTAWGHLHNHPFSDSKAIDWGGAILPSEYDVSSFEYFRKELGLKNIMITNGLETFAMPTAQLTKYPRSFRR